LVGIRLFLSINHARPGDEYELAGEDASHVAILKERLDRVAAKKGELLVARWRRKAIGHIYLWLEPADEEELRKRLSDTPLLMNLWVRKNFRRKGVGTALVTRAERRLRKLGHHQVALGVETSNHAAVNLYTRHRYQEWGEGELKTHYDEFHADGSQTLGWEICAVYTKQLGPGIVDRLLALGRKAKDSSDRAGVLVDV
jgi:ribosomal protein S18 acetylase RimI-like enzyme